MELERAVPVVWSEGIGRLGLCGTVEPCTSGEQILALAGGARSVLGQELLIPDSRLPITFLLSCLVVNMA